jgi:hypothetical protein
MNLRTTVPFTRFNNYLDLSADQRNVMAIHSGQFIGKSFVDPIITGDTNDPATRFNAEFLNYSFVYVITETVGDYPYPYFSEKTWKAMSTGSPFIMINAQNSLLKLQEFGFKTFSEWWDEGYDTKNTVADRIEAAVNILNEFSHKSISELQAIRNTMSHVIDYNRHHLTTFQKLDLENITNQI